MTAKLTKEQFIEKAQAVHGNKYNYSKVDYVNNSTPVIVICPTHGEFHQKPNKHVDSKQGCPLCSKKQSTVFPTYGERFPVIEGKKYVVVDPKSDFSTDDYRNKSGIISTYLKKTYNIESGMSSFKERNYFKLYNHYWWEDYLEIRLVDDIKKETIKCPYCDWTTTDLENKSGIMISHFKKVHNKTLEEVLLEHPEMKNYFHNTLNMTAKLTKEQFIEKAKAVHGNKYDYSKVDYVNNRTPIIIIDPILGEFKQTPSNHLKGQGHPSNKGKKISSLKRQQFDSSNIIERFHQAHPEGGYDYSKVVYKTMDTPVTIICLHLDSNGVEYGEYQQTPRVHLKGCGHPREGKDKYLSNLPRPKITNEEYVTRCIKQYCGQYDYKYCNYEGIHSIVTIICPKHGPFDIDASNHLYGGKGCPHCGHSISKAENEIFQYLTTHFNGEVTKRNHTILNRKELDIFIPSRNLAIEYNGCKWHTEWFGGKDKHYHYDKMIECNSKGVRLIHIFEDEYMCHKDIVLSKIGHILGMHQDLPKVGARKCKIQTIHKFACDVFLNTNHIQGAVSASAYYGAFTPEGDLAAVMTFVKRKDNEYELNRFATNNRMVVSGIADRILKRFIKDYNPSKIISFADRRWTTNLESNLYTKLGFTLEYCTKPDYHYYNEKVDRFQRFHKFGFRKQQLHNKYGFDMSMTEEEMVRELGYDRIWDCGLAKYVYINTSFN